MQLPESKLDIARHRLRNERISPTYNNRVEGQYLLHIIFILKQSRIPFTVLMQL